MSNFFLNFTAQTASSSDAASTLGVVRSVYTTPPPTGHAIEVANGVWWTRLPLENGNHVNAYVLDHDDGWTLVDTGTNSESCRSALNALFASEPFSRRRLTRLIITHYHPDHIGLAGEFYNRGASLWTTRLCWLFARTFQMDHRDLPYSEQIQFAERAGIRGTHLAAYARRPPSDYPQQVAPIPYTFHRIQNGDVISIGPRNWKVVVGHGHAVEHATLWSDDGLAITGDQILSGIASSLSVRAFEPEADPVSDWIMSCHRMIHFADDRVLCLPGHNMPFTGAVTRCRQLIASQESVLARLMEHLARPSTALDCLAPVYRRQLQNHEVASLVTETMGFLNHLHKFEFVRRTLAADKTYLWQRIKSFDKDAYLDERSTQFSPKPR